MNRTQRALVKKAHKKLAMNRAFKNDALYERNTMHNSLHPGSSDSHFTNEKEIFDASKKALRRLKKYNGPTGMMSESNYMEFMGA